jgi:putative hydrolase of the HAD superfamily
LSLSNSVKAIFFDLDGTLRHSVPTGGDVFTAYAIQLGLHVNPEDRIRAMRWEHLYWASSADLSNDILAHTFDTENFWTEYSRRRLIALGIDPAVATDLARKVSIHMSEVYKPQSIIPDDVRQTLTDLQQAGYLMAVLSNRDKPFHDLLESHGISQFFSFSLAGGEVDSYKPKPGLFQHALNRVRLAPEEAIYVGDNYFADVVGARRAGLRPVLYDPENIFPEADCTTIRSFNELNSVVKDI